MPITNLITSQLTAADYAAALKALTDFGKAIANVKAKLSAEERKRYGSINEQMKLFVNKVQDFNQKSPALSTNKVNWVEFQSDYDARDMFTDLINKLNQFITQLEGPRIMHDYDNLQAALEDYAYTSYEAGSNTSGFEEKHKELKQFFERPGKTKPDDVADDAEAEPQ